MEPSFKVLCTLVLFGSILRVACGSDQGDQASPKKHEVKEIGFGVTFQYTPEEDARLRRWFAKWNQLDEMERKMAKAICEAYISSYVMRCFDRMTTDEMKSNEKQILAILKTCGDISATLKAPIQPSQKDDVSLQSGSGVSDQNPSTSNKQLSKDKQDGKGEEDAAKD